MDGSKRVREASRTESKIDRDRLREWRRTIHILYTAAAKKRPNENQEIFESLGSEKERERERECYEKW